MGGFALRVVSASLGFGAASRRAPLVFRPCLSVRLALCLLCCACVVLRLAVVRQSCVLGVVLAFGGCLFLVVCVGRPGQGTRVAGWWPGWAFGLCVLGLGSGGSGSV